MNFTIYPIPPVCNSFDLIELFKPYGEVRNAHINGSKGFVTVILKDDQMRSHMLKEAILKGRRVFIEPENISYGGGHQNYSEYNHRPPVNNWIDQQQYTGRQMDHRSMQYESDLHSSTSELWRQRLSVPKTNDFEGKLSGEYLSHSFEYVDSHGYSRDPTFRPIPEYYYRIKLLESRPK